MLFNRHSSGVAGREVHGRCEVVGNDDEIWRRVSSRRSSGICWLGKERRLRLRGLSWCCGCCFGERLVIADIGGWEYVFWDTL